MNDDPYLHAQLQHAPSGKVEKFLHDMKATAGSRFNAARRLEDNDGHLTWITAMTSAYIIALTILPYFWKLPQAVTDTLNLATVVLSVVILASALLHNSKRDAVNAEQHHRSALEIKEIHREVAARGTISEDEFLDYTRKYSAVLQKYSINHSDLDFQKYMVDRPEQFTFLTFVARLKIRVMLVIRDNLQMALLIAVTGGFLWLVFFYALPVRLPS
jgi:uncharacterized membrane protein